MLYYIIFRWPTHKETLREQHIFLFTVDAIEVLIKIASIHNFPQVDQFIRIQFLFTSCAFPIGQSVLNRNLFGLYQMSQCGSLPL